MIIKTCIFFLFFFFLSLWTPFALKAQTSMTIQINSTTGELFINQQKIKRPYDLAQLMKILGKPDRVETETHKVRYERRGIQGAPASSKMVEVKDHYYLFDHWGLILIKNESIFKSQPPKLVICYKNARKYNHTRPLEYFPATPFQGQLNINGHKVNSRATLIPENVTYESNQLDLWGLSFGLTSIGTNIDRLYSTSGKIYMMVYLDSPANLTMSYIEVK